VLHHRRAMDVLQGVAAGAVFRLRRRAGRGQVPGAAGIGGHRLAPGARGALLPRAVPRRGRQGLRAHGARQGPGRTRGAVPPRAAQRHAAHPDRHRVGHSAAVHGQPDRRVVLRHPRPGQLHHRRHQRAGFLHRARHGVPGVRAVYRGPDPGRYFLYAGRPPRTLRVTAMPKFVFLWTDVALFLLVAGVLGYAWRVRRSPALRATWARVGRDAPAMSSAVILLAFVAVGLLDSIHYRPQLPPAPGAAADAPPIYAPAVRSALDGLLDGTVLARPEKTYSAPLAARQFTKETELIDGQPVRDFPRLRSGGAHLAEPDTERWPDALRRLAWGLAGGAAAALAGGVLLCAGLARGRASWRQALADVAGARTDMPWHAMWITFALLCLVVGAVAGLATGYHVFGTDRTGNDVLWQALKSVRTALVIGSLTTLAMLPPAIGCGIAAGYFKGRIDDAIQYVYTTLTSIPGVLLV